MIYCITATVERKGITSQLPTFYLDNRVQGIMNEAHARFIAEEIINPCRVKGIKVNAMQLRLIGRYGREP